ncbi:MAG: MBL fold metallo-hydrolase [Gemmatimonadaceae bacterium]|jgi:Cft2 family RNA processing exonuclease|nr:MBL fold metallo-hydrolase [Gemmatimonadaceae bacterium]
MIVLTPHGLHCPDADLWLDARTGPGRVFVSHAHGDHATTSPAVLCSRETAVLAAHRGMRPRDCLTPPFGAWTPSARAEVALVSAGHTLGSAMLVVRGERGTAVYTGDFKRRPNPFAPPVVMPRCDVLVTECTFGHPRYRFPPDDDTIGRLIAFCRAALADDVVPVVCAYPFGKGQEALHHLLTAGLDVAVHGQIATLTEVHATLGATMPATGRWTRYARDATAGRVLLTTPGSRRSPMVTAMPRRRVCLLTGWALHPGAHNLYRDCDLVLPLSDHADFDELVASVRESGAQTVYTVHGDAGFAAHLRGLGIDATHLAAHPNAAPDAVQLGLAL